MTIPLNKTRISDKEKNYVLRSLESGAISGDGSFSHFCHDKLVQITGAKGALLTHSCTAALEMTALLLELRAGDEVIMPSYTFVSTAISVVLRGAVPIFVDIRPDCFNIDETKIEAAITKHTKAIYGVHYAGVSCDMDPIIELAKKHNLKVVEDAAQGLGATYKGRQLGSIGDLGAFSFHATKNIQCGEGGALVINNPQYITRAEIIREKGTNRKTFLQGEADKYTWLDLGSSYLPSDLLAACLLAQLEDLQYITNTRLELWYRYHDLLILLEEKQLLRRPIIPSFAKHNAHIYHILLPNQSIRNNLINEFRKQQIQAFFHYIPLHSSPGGQKFGKISGNMDVTDRVSSCVLRLPLYPDLSFVEQDRIVKILFEFFDVNQKKCDANKVFKKAQQVILE